jgi:hypothetical protein
VLSWLGERARDNQAALVGNGELGCHVGHRARAARPFLDVKAASELGIAAAQRAQALIQRQEGADDVFLEGAGKVLGILRGAMQGLGALRGERGQDDGPYRPDDAEPARDHGDPQGIAPGDGSHRPKPRGGTE